MTKKRRKTKKKMKERIKINVKKVGKVENVEEPKGQPRERKKLRMINLKKMLFYRRETLTR